MPAWASLVWLTVAGLPVAARHPRWLQQLLRVLFCFLLIVAVTFNNTRQHASPWPGFILPRRNWLVTPKYQLAQKNAARDWGRKNIRVSDIGVSSAPPIPGTPAAPIASVPISGRVVVSIAGRIVIYRLRGITGHHRCRCVGRGWRYDNNGRCCRSCVAVCWGCVAVGRCRQVSDRSRVVIVAITTRVHCLGRCGPR